MQTSDLKLFEKFSNERSEILNTKILTQIYFQHKIKYKCTVNIIVMLCLIVLYIL